MNTDIRTHAGTNTYVATQTQAQTHGQQQAAEATSRGKTGKRQAQIKSCSRRRRGTGGAPEGSGGVDNVQGTMAKAGLPVCAPLWLLLVAVACWVAAPCTVPISLHHHQFCDK